MPFALPGQTIVGRRGRRVVVGGTVAAAVAGIAPTTFATTPTVQYHIPAGSTVSTTTIAALPVNVLAATSVTDMRGLADASNGASTGPVVMTDALGRKFLRFTNASGTGTNGDGPNGPNLLTIANAFTASQRSIAVFMVGRVHRANPMTFLSLGVAGASPPNTGGGVLNTRLAATGGSTVLSASSRLGSAATANASAMYPGCQMQVLGVSSRSTTGTGTNVGQRLSINTAAGNIPNTSAALSGTGATIGSNAFAPDVGYFDLYEMVIFTGDLTDAQHDAIAAALVSNWAIPAVTDQLILEGDSITAGVLDATGASGTGVITGETLGMQLTKPGAELIPATCRVINQGVSGNSVPNLVTRRDSTDSIYSTGKLAGRNIVAVQVGRNDWTGTTQSGTDTYTAIVALINTTTTGYLQRGFEVVQAINIANAGVTASWLQQRTLLRASGFLTDTLSGPGQTYDGKVSRLELPLITVGATTPFNAAADINTTYYQGSSGTHPSRIGQVPIATGGDTPQYGYGAVL